MELSGQIKTTCPPDVLVRVMRDPAALAQLLPAGSKMSLNADGSYLFSVSKNVGPIKLTLPGKMTLTPGAQSDEQILTARAAHLIGGKVDLALTLQITQGAKVTQMAYKGDLTATGLAGRILQEHRERANASLKSAMLRLKFHAEQQATASDRRAATA